MPTPFPDRSETLFGRAADLAYLLARTERPGVTFLFGPSQLGKSTLLQEVARRRSQPVPDTFLGLKASLPGYTESQGQNEDLFLRAVADLYTRWITDATFAEQAGMVTGQQRSDLIGRFGEGVGGLFEKVAKLAGKPAETVGGIVRTALGTLAQANRDLKSGGLQLTPLSLDQGRDLLTMVYSITQRPILLILDQWEKARLPADADLLENLVRHLEDWPPCHILVGALPLPDPQAAAESLQSGFPYEVDRYTLPVMNLEDPGAAADLLAFVRLRVPAATELDDPAILDLVAGHPEVVNRWTKREPILTVARMKQLADEAHTHRFSELKALSTLPDAQRLLAMRLALLPAGNATTTWNVLKPILTESTQLGDLDRLYLSGLLERSSSTFFGHTKRAEVALQIFIKTFPDQLSTVANRLCLDLAASIRDLSPDAVPHGEALVRLHTLACAASLSPLSCVLCQAASSLFEQPAALFQQATFEWNLYLQVSHYKAVDLTRVTPLLTLGLFNTLIYASKEQELTARDALLDELRALANEFPEDAAVREALAKGFVNTRNDAKREQDLTRRDALLNELRALANAFPEDTAVREALAKGLYNTRNDAKREQELPRRDALLDELRALANAFPEDAAVREELAKSLYNTRNDFTQEQDLTRRDDLLDELRALANAFLQDAAVREQLAGALYNTLNDARQEQDLTRRDALFDELRTLANAFPQDAAVRQQLAKGLFNTRNDAKREQELTRRDALLDELRALANAFPQDAAIREALAGGLYNTRHDANQEQELTRRDALLDELRALANTFPQDATVRERLTLSLFNTLIDAEGKQELTRRDALLDELRTLAHAFPQDAVVCEQLGKGLFNTLIEVSKEQEPTRRDALLDELRTLANAFPQAVVVREGLAGGLFNTLIDAEEKQELTRRDALLDELRTLANAFPQDAIVRERLAGGLFNTLVDAEQELTRRGTLLDELRSLADAFPHDPGVRAPFAKGVAVCLLEAQEAGETESSLKLWTELQAIAREHPEDAFWSELASLFEERARKTRAFS